MASNKRFIFDLETNGLLDVLTSIHCLVIRDIDTGEIFDYRPEEVCKGLDKLAQASLLVGHNIIGFDIPAIQKVRPEWKHNALVRDSFVCARLFWPHIAEDDFAKYKTAKLPGQLIGTHKLEAWGYRLGILKDEYKGGWEAWNETMHAYCIQDVRVTATLWQRIENEAKLWGIDPHDHNPPPGKDCIDLEHRVAEIVEKVQKHGFRFDELKAASLHGKISAKHGAIRDQLTAAFPPRIVESVFVPKVNNKSRGYIKGVPFTKRTTVVFNPASRQQVAERLQLLGWKPTEFGKDGTPTVDDEILNSLPYPEAKLLAEFYMLEKRLGQIAVGPQAWFRHVRNGRIHGRINGNGAHTGRMTHSSPNMAQVPANDAPYGEECRDCFIADEGFVLVGCDADALELRDLAGYMARWDDGEYIKTVLEGNKANGTDMHSVNAKAIGCTRDVAKVFFYAMIYGAGDAKLGSIVGGGAKAGKRARENLMKGVPALGALIKAVQAKIASQGFVVGLDGRRLTARSANAALNTLLQSAGAVQMKRALVLMYDNLEGAEWKWGRDYSIVGLIHDEWQANVRPDLVEMFKGNAVNAIRAAGEFYSFRCPLDGQAKEGKSWKETH